MLRENYELKEKVIDMQERSMRDNLLFCGVDEAPEEKVKGADNMHTEKHLKRFLREIMHIEEDIQFHVVHRLRPRQDNKPTSSNVHQKLWKIQITEFMNSFLEK